MSLKNFMYAIKYYSCEPFIEIWRMRKLALKSSFFRDASLIGITYFLIKRNYYMLGFCTFTFLIFHFYNRYQSGDHVRAMREKYKEKIRGNASSEPPA